jgi:hypothetical protein
MAVIGNQGLKVSLVVEEQVIHSFSFTPRFAVEKSFKFRQLHYLLC